MGYSTYAFVKEDIIHLTGNRLGGFLKKRYDYMRQYYLQDFSRRRYKMVSQKDAGRLLKYILISLTLIVPLWHALKGYTKIRDRAWFLHPVICLGFLGVYGWATVQWQFKRHE